MQKLNNLEWGLKEKMQWEGKKDAVDTWLQIENGWDRKLLILPECHLRSQIPYLWKKTHHQHILQSL